MKKETLLLNDRGRFRILKDRIIVEEGVFGAIVDMTGIQQMSFDTGFGGDCDRGLSNPVLADATGWGFFSITKQQVDSGEILGKLKPGRYAAFVVERQQDDPGDEDVRLKVVVRIDEKQGVEFLRTFAIQVEKELAAIARGTPGKCD